MATIIVLSIMILPTVISLSETSLRAVPKYYYDGAVGLGSSKERDIFNVVLPSVMNGILSGIILTIGRIFGETVALLFTAGIFQQIAKVTSSGSSLSIHMYLLQAEGHNINEAYATEFVLLLIVVLINSLSIFIGNKLGGINE